MEQKKEQLRIIKQRTIDFLRQNSHGALYNGDGSKCTDWLAEELLEAGPYPGTLIYKDIDYDDLSPNAWRSFNHLDRLRAILVDEGPALFADSGRMDKLLALLRYWLQADPNSANWFHNQIGSPKYMGIIALLMGDQLPEDMRPGVMEIVSRGSLDQPPKERIHYTYRKHPTLWTGANLIWGAGVTMYHALIKQDVQLLEKAVRWAETALAYEEEGIQEDGAFRQHGPRWYSGGYGRSFLLEMLPFYLCLEGTSFCFAEEKTRILLTHFLDGLPHMQHRGYFDYGAVGRELAREGKTIERKARTVQIISIDILEVDLPRVRMSVHCSKGTYIRTLCHDIGAALGCGGCMEKLLRTKVGIFELKDTLKLAEIDELAKAGKVEDRILSVDDLFADYTKVWTAPEFDVVVHNGNRVKIKMFREKIPANTERLRVYDSNNSFIGIYEYCDERRDYKPVKMFYENN